MPFGHCQDTLMYKQKNYFSLAPLSHSPLLQFKPCHSRPLDNGIQLILREQVGAVFDEDLSPDCFNENTESSGSDDQILVGKNRPREQNLS